MFLYFTLFCLLSVSAVTRDERISQHLANQKTLFEATIDCGNQILWQEFRSSNNAPRATHDVVITAAQGVKLYAHSAFLVSHSPYFLGKIKAARKRSPNTRLVEIGMEGISAKVLRVLIGYMYFGEAQIPGTFLSNNMQIRLMIGNLRRIFSLR
jgi:hypothetical protein